MNKKLLRIFPVPDDSEKLTTGERLLLLGLLVFGLVLVVYLSGSWSPRYYWGSYNVFSHASFLCPACGGTRAISLLFRGQLAEAWQHNQLFVLALPLIFFGGFSLVRSICTGYPLTGRFIQPYMVWGALIVVLLFGVLRNIPLAALDFLRPPPY